MAEATDKEKQSIVDAWLEAEVTESPLCQVVASLKQATKAGKLDEEVLVAKLRQLFEEPSPPASDVPN